MSGTEYTKVYVGNFITIQKIIGSLENAGIIPIVKDESESGRLAGFGPSIQGHQELYVHNNELEQAQIILDRIKSDMEI